VLSLPFTVRPEALEGRTVRSRQACPSINDIREVTFYETIEIRKGRVQKKGLRKGGVSQPEEEEIEKLTFPLSIEITKISRKFK